MVAVPRALQPPPVGTALGPAQPGLLGWAGLGWGEGREVGRGWQGLGWAGQCPEQGNSSVREWWEHAREGLPAWLGAAEPGLRKGSPELQGQGRGHCSGPLLACAEQKGGPGHSSPHHSLPGPARWSWSVQGQALPCGAQGEGKASLKKRLKLKNVPPLPRGVTGPGWDRLPLFDVVLV